jgi:hypothetical protein
LHEERNWKANLVLCRPFNSLICENFNSKLGRTLHVSSFDSMGTEWNLPWK